MQDDLIDHPLAGLLFLAYGGIATIVLLLVASRADRHKNHNNESRDIHGA